MTLNPVLRIDTQMSEAILAMRKVERTTRAREPSRLALAADGHPLPD